MGRWEERAGRAAHAHRRRGKARRRGEGTSFDGEREHRVHDTYLDRPDSRSIAGGHASVCELDELGTRAYATPRTARARQIVSRSAITF